MSDTLPWKTHYEGCRNRRPNVAYPRRVCDGCRMYEKAIDDAIDLMGRTRFESVSDGQIAMDALAKFKERP